MAMIMGKSSRKAVRVSGHHSSPVKRVTQEKPAIIEMLTDENESYVTSR
jgi:hypothetical protein